MKLTTEKQQQQKRHYEMKKQCVSRSTSKRGRPKQMSPTVTKLPNEGFPLSTPVIPNVPRRTTLINHSRTLLSFCVKSFRNQRALCRAIIITLPLPSPKGEEKTYLTKPTSEVLKYRDFLKKTPIREGRQLTYPSKRAFG